MKTFLLRLFLPCLLIFALALSLAPSSAAQSSTPGAVFPFKVGLTWPAVSAGSGSLGAFSVTGLLYFQVDWVVSGTVSGCSVTVDGARALGGSFTTGSIVSSQPCTSTGTFTTSSPTENLQAQVSYSITGSGTVTFTVRGFVLNPAGSNGGGGCIATVSTLSSSCGTVAGTLASVTDGSTSSDCSVGGGTNKNACIYTGSAWVFAGNSGSAPNFGQVLSGTNTGQTHTVGSGGTLNTASGATVDFSLIGTGVFKVPSSAGGVASATKMFVFDSTAGFLHAWNGADSIWPQSIASVAHKFVISYNQATGLYAAAQPASTDLSDLPIPVSSGGTGATDQLFVDATTFTGADACAKIAAAGQSLNSNARGGVVDARGFAAGGTQTCGSNPFAGVTVPVKFLLAGTTWNTTAQWSLCNGCRADSPNWSSTVVVAVTGFPTNTAIFNIGDGTNTFFDTRFEHIQADCGNTPIAGCYGFQGQGIDEGAGASYLRVRNCNAVNAGGCVKVNSAPSTSNYTMDHIYVLYNSGATTTADGVLVSGTSSQGTWDAVTVIGAGAGTTGHAFHCAGSFTGCKVRSLHFESLSDGAYWNSTSWGYLYGATGDPTNNSGAAVLHINTTDSHYAIDYSDLMSVNTTYILKNDVTGESISGTTNSGNVSLAHGSYPQVLALQAANTVLANVTSSSASPTAASLVAGFEYYTAGSGFSAATAAQAATLIQGLTGCNTATYVFTPQASDCVAPSGGGSGTVNSGTTSNLAYYPSPGGTAVGPTTDFTYNGTHTWAMGASGILDLTAMSLSNLKFPLTTAGLVRTTTGGIPSSAELSGDVTTSGSNAATVIRLNGTSLAGLSTGILKNTTGTGVPSIAAASDVVGLVQGLTGCNTATYVFTPQASDCVAPSGGGGANTALSNLASPAINLALSPGTDNSIALDDLTHRYTNAWLAGVAGWTNGSGSADAGLSRDAAGVVDVGNGTAGDTSGTLKATKVATVGSNGGMSGTEGTGASGCTPALTTDCLYPDSTLHTWHVSANNVDLGAIMTLAGAQTVTGVKTFPSASITSGEIGTLSAGSNGLGTLATIATGTLTNGDFCTYSSTGPTIACNSTGGGGDTVTSPNSTLTVGGTSSNTTVDLALGHPNTWTGAQTLEYALGSGTGTVGKLACATASNTQGNCTALPPNNFLGVFTAAGFYVSQGIISVTLDATVNVTYGDILCASSTGTAEGHDNGSVACANGEWIGIVTTTASSVSSATVALRLQ